MKFSRCEYELIGKAFVKDQEKARQVLEQIQAAPPFPSPSQLDEVLNLVSRLDAPETMRIRIFILACTMLFNIGTLTFGHLRPGIRNQIAKKLRISTSWVSKSLSVAKVHYQCYPSFKQFVDQVISQYNQEQKKCSVVSR